MQDATLDDALWPATAALIDEACGLTGSALAVGDGFGDNVRVSFAGFYRQGCRCHDLEREYFGTYHPVDERLPRLRQLPDGHLAHVLELYTGEELKTSATYNEWLPRCGARNGLSVRLNGPGGSRIVWGIADSAQAGGWGSDQIKMIERLLPHIRHFVWTRQALGSAEALTASLTELLDNTRIGVIHLDHRGRIAEANDCALGLLQGAGGLCETEGGLGAWLPSDDADFQRLLAGALPARENDPPAGGVMAVRRPPPLPSLVLHVNPVAAYGKRLGTGRLAVVVLVVDPLSQPRIDPGLVAMTLGLTPAESRVAVMVAQGRTVAEIAWATGRQKSTVYWLLRRVYGKLEISRQVDLARLVLSLSELPGSRG